MFEELELNDEDAKATQTEDDDDDENQNGVKFEIIDLTHNSVLNCLFLLTNNNKLLIYDCNTHLLLKRLEWQPTTQDNGNGLTASPQSPPPPSIAVKLLNINEKCFILSDQTLCTRSTHDGIFLLDSVFQSTFKLLNEAKEFFVEFTLNDGLILLSSFKQIECDAVNGLDGIVKQVNRQLSQYKGKYNEQNDDHLSLLNAVSVCSKWNTIKIKGTYNSLISTLTQTLDELKRVNMQSLALPILSSLLDRLYRLDLNLHEYMHAAIKMQSHSLINYDKRFMSSEANRRATFHDWPHMDYKWLLPDTLAQAGFYHQPAQQGDDRTICFVCNLCLVAWEQSDQPWSEHERHSPICQFVRGEITENVPLSLTIATQPALQVFKNENEKIVCTSDNSSDRYFAVSDIDGHIVVYDTKDLLKELMHVQLYNESEYNREHKLKIQSLSFYYRNHKHVLYGSFLIAHELFIFSFNIFDIYKSYQSTKLTKATAGKNGGGTSVSSQTTSKQHKSGGSGSKEAGTSKSQTAAPTSKDLIKSIIQNEEAFTVYMDNILKLGGPSMNQSTSMSQTPQTGSTASTEPQTAQQLLENLVNKTVAAAASSQQQQQQQQQLTDSLNKKAYFKLNSGTDSSTSTSATGTGAGAPSSSSSMSSSQLTSLVNLFNNPLFIESALNDQFDSITSGGGGGAAQAPQAPSVTTTTTTTTTTTSSQPVAVKHTSSSVQQSKLSNYLIVRFEIMTNNESTSKSKSKYKKSIKIQSVHTKIFTDPNDLNVYTTQKAYEFTEKCFSFRLACLDLTVNQQVYVKLINLYDKSLIALVNYDARLRFFQIKHEESSTIQTQKMLQQQQDAQAVVVTTATGPSVLTATSSSRLNLTEFSIENLVEPASAEHTATDTEMSILNLMPICVSTFDDDLDVRVMVMLASDGVVYVIDPFKFVKLTQFQLPQTTGEEKFVKITYCSGIDKLCCVSDKGKVYMINLRRPPIIQASPVHGGDLTTSILDIDPQAPTALATATRLLVQSALKCDVIGSLHALIQFDQAKVNFSAKFPSTWKPILPEQNEQRKHPQHILADAQNLTKSWKYVHDSSIGCGSMGSTAREQHTAIHNDRDMLIEVYLNKPIQLACVQLQLKFNKDLTFPYELSLLKKKSFQQESSVDSSIDFNLNSKYDVLYGPVDLRDYIDMTDTRTCTITLCSDKLLETRTNLYFLNLKAPSSTTTTTSTCSAAFSDELNILHNISITLRKYKKTNLPNERLERELMLKQVKFFESLVTSVTVHHHHHHHHHRSSSSSSGSAASGDCDQLKCLDIVNWIVYNHFTCHQTVWKYVQVILVNLKELLNACYLTANRSISRKATVLFTFLLNPQIDKKREIFKKLNDALLANLDNLLCFETSSSLYWYFMLLNQIIQQQSATQQQTTYELCLSQLLKLSKLYKYNPYYSILKMRFNYQCLPFELNLFDVDLYFKFDLNSKLLQKLPTSSSSSSSYNNAYTPFGNTNVGPLGTITTTTTSNGPNFATSNGGGGGGDEDFYFQSLNDLFGSNAAAAAKAMYNADSTTVSNNELVTIKPSVIGLLEVLPLHFKCIALSQGTSIEKTNSTKQDFSLYMMPNYTNLFNPVANNNSDNGAVSVSATTNIDFTSTDPLMDTTIPTLASLTKKEIDNSAAAAKMVGDTTTPKNTPLPGQTPPNETATTAITNLDTSMFNSILNYQPLQLLVIERMEPVSRHSVTLDFGFQIALTDIIIPSCSELASISIDIWTQSEQKDSRRICLSNDINEIPIILNDMQPALVCRYLKLIMVAYSSNIVKAKIPIGYYFGYPYIYHSHEQHNGNNEQQLRSHLTYLEKLYEDTKCYYTMSINKLRKLLADIKYPNDNIGHLKMMQFTLQDNVELQQRIKDSYNDCLDYQFQLNLNKQMIKRLGKLLGSSAPVATATAKNKVNNILQDQLRVINNLLLKTLLGLRSTNHVDKCLVDGRACLSLENTAELFHNLCVNNTNLDRECTNLLLRTCSTQPWWGEFISSCLKKYFINAYMNNTIQLNRLFLLLNDLCIKSLNLNYFNESYNKSLFRSIFDVIVEILEPLDNGQDTFNIEITSLEWILLFLSRLLNIYDRFKFIQNRWEFLDHIQIQHAQQQQQHQQQYIKNLNNATSLHTNTKKLAFYSKSNKFMKKKLFSKNLFHTNSSSSSSSGGCSSGGVGGATASAIPTRVRSAATSGNKNQTKNLYLLKLIQLPREESLKLCKLLLKFLLKSNSYCSSDLFVITCRILSSICSFTLPLINLNEILANDECLRSLLMLCISAEFNHGSVCWGSPWSSHAILCLLMDLVDIEKYITSKTACLITENDFQLDLTDDLYDATVTRPKTSSFLIKFLLKTYDLRLNMTVHQTLDAFYTQKMYKQIDYLNKSISLMQTNATKHEVQLNLADFYLNFTNFDTNSTIKRIQATLELLFLDLNACNLENLLNFWLQLCVCETTGGGGHNDATATPTILKLNELFLLNFINYLLDYKQLSIKLWFLVFRFLTSNFTIKNSKFLNETECLFALLDKFLGYQNINTKNFINTQTVECTLMGDECCAAFCDFLKHLFSLQCDETALFVRLLRLLNGLLDSKNGCVYGNMGVLDAQICFVNFLLTKKRAGSFDVDLAEFDDILKVFFNNLSNLIKVHITLYPRLSLKGVLNPRSCFSSVLSSLLNSTTVGLSHGTAGSVKKSGFGKTKATGTSTTTGTSSKYLKYFDLAFGSSGGSSATTNATTHAALADNASNSNTTLMCNRDLLVCLLVKFAINLVTNEEYEEANEAMNGQDQQSKQPTSNATDVLYNDDLFMQQMFIYNDCLQIDEDYLDEPSSTQSIEEARYKFMLNTLSSSVEDEHENITSSLNSDVFKRLNPIKQANEPPPSSTATTQHSKPSPTKPIHLIDSILDDTCLETFIETLALCQSSALAMVICNSGYALDINLSDMQTPGDYLFVFLKTIACHEPYKLINSIHGYLSKLKRLSEPLLWLITYLFNSNDAAILRYFLCDKNGLEVISNGLLSTTRQLLYSGPCIISSLMNHLDYEKQMKTALNGANGHLNIDSDSTEGFTNFAPYASITCTNPKSNPVDVLVQSTVQPRRARTAVWSYHFQPNEHKVGLYLTFPYVFLLKEIHIVPHTVTFNNCPAYVSIEVSRDMGYFMQPVSAPIYTLGMTSIKLQLNKSELVNTIKINFYKTKDTQVMGLLQVKLLGYPMFENMLSAKPDMMLTPIEDLVSRSNMGWLRLLHMCMNSTTASNNDLELYVCDRLNDQTIKLCTNLLASPAMVIYDKTIEQILIKLSRNNRSRCLTITKFLLYSEYGFDNGLYSIPHGILMETIVNILYQINEQLTDDLKSLILKFLFNSIANRLMNPPSSMILHCISCILYKCDTLHDMITTDMFNSLIEYIIDLNENLYLKQAYNWILCSVVHLHCGLLDTLLDKIDLNLISSHDNNEELFSLLDILSYSVQSDNVLDYFLKSTFFTDFVRLYIEFKQSQIRSEPVQSDQFAGLSRKVAKQMDISFIKIFISIANYKTGQKWFNTESGVNVWRLTLDILCTEPPPHSKHDFDQQDEEEEEEFKNEINLLFIELIKRMLFLNKLNQNQFCEYITKLIREQKVLNGFLHQIILQILLDDSNVKINFQRGVTVSSTATTTANSKKCELFKSICNSSLTLNLPHPVYATGNNYRTLDIQLNRTCADVLGVLTDMPTLFSTASEQSNEDISETLLGKFKGDYTKPQSKVRLRVNALSNCKYLPNECTFEQLINGYLYKTQEESLDKLLIDVCFVSSNVDEQQIEELDEIYVWCKEQQSRGGAVDVTYTPLDAFVKCNGLIVLAERLPIIIPFIHEPLLNVTDKDQRFNLNEASGTSGGGGAGAGAKTSPDFVDYVIMNDTDEPFDDDIYVVGGTGGTTSATNPLGIGGLASDFQLNNCNMKLKKVAMPPHAFLAFGLFLKIPFYSQILLNNKKQAQCLLKLLLGCSASRSTSNNEEFNISLSTMPFTSLNKLLRSCNPNVESICKYIVENQILTLILSILSTLSHHQHRQAAPHFANKFTFNTKLERGGDQPCEDMAQLQQQQQQTAKMNATNTQAQNLYWAKGTGFGTGSTVQQWDAERTLMQQKMEEEHVTCILEILASFIKCYLNEQNEEGVEMCEHVIELFDHSCVINALSSYLRNDSVLDMSRHVPLYKASLELLQAFILSINLRELILKCKIIDLLKNMKLFVDSYMARIKLTDEDGGLTCLVPVLQHTHSLAMNLIEPIEKQYKANEDDENGRGGGGGEGGMDATDVSIETIYNETMKELQFDAYAMVDDSTGSIKMNVPYYYESSLIDAANLSNANRAKRLAQETVTLSNSLPLSYCSSVFVRCDEERLDVLKVLITGPQDTPYSNGCFEFDVFFPSDYPDSPPLVNLQTTGNQTVRFNPNLYHDGKVCLSVLNTWHGRPEERWNAQTSSFLQVIVSIQSLILVSEPYFNEPGYERLRGTPAGTATSLEYDANIRQATVKWAILEMIKKPLPCFKEVIRKHFYYKRNEIKAQCEQWAKEMEPYINDKQIGQSVSKSYLALKRHMAQLYEELDKLEASEAAQLTGTEQHNDDDEPQQEQQTVVAADDDEQIPDLKSD